MNKQVKRRHDEDMRKWIYLSVLVILLWGTYRIALPLPAGTVHQTVASEYVGWKTHKPATLIQKGEYAVGSPAFGGAFMKSSNQKSVPIASLTKMMTAVLVLDAHPLRGKESGPVIHFDKKDVQLLHKDIANGDSVVYVQSGETMTERQALEALLIPSGDNIATKLAQWVSGSVPNFVAKMNTTAKALGMFHTHYADTSGVNPKTVSDAQDQWLMASKFMTFPILREIASKKSARIPVAGTIHNYNTLLGQDGIVGIKTGNTSQAGGNLASAKYITVNSKQHLLIGVVLGQKSLPPLAKVFKVTPKILRLGQENLTTKTVVHSNQVVGNLVFPWGKRIRLVADRALTIGVFPEEKISKTLHTSAPLRSRLKSGAILGTLVVTTPTKSYKIKVKAATDPRPPSLFWKLIH